MKRTWQDVEEIALDLVELHPQTDPLTLSFAQIRELVVALPGFADDPRAAADRVLEAIQMAWYDEYED
jgi:FeS assembly protein IscX